MSTYISLFNWTDQGIRNIKDAPQRIDHFKKSVETTGGKVRGFYFTMGKYDGVVIVEYPDDESAAVQLLAAGSGGNVRTRTMKAYPEDQFRNIITKV